MSWAPVRAERDRPGEARGASFQADQETAERGWPGAGVGGGGKRQRAGLGGPSQPRGTDAGGAGRGLAGPGGRGAEPRWC